MKIKNKFKLLGIGLILMLSLTACGEKNEGDIELYISKKAKSIAEEASFKIKNEDSQNDYFTVYGEIGTLDDSARYNSEKITKYLKASENNKIEFDLDKEYNLIFVSDKNCNEAVLINDKEYKFIHGIMKATLEPGSYKIKSPKANIYYIKITNVSDNLEITTNKGKILVSKDSVDIKKEKDETIYTFKDGTVAVEKNGKATLKEEGDNKNIIDLFK